MLFYYITVTVALACFLHYPGPNLPMAVFFTVAAAFHSAIVIVCFANLSARRRYRLHWDPITAKNFGARFR